MTQGKANSELEALLKALFDSGVEVGGDIVLERQFENDSEAYLRYRARVVKPHLEVIERMMSEEYRRGQIEGRKHENVYSRSIVNTTLVRRYDELTKSTGLEQVGDDGNATVTKDGSQPYD